MRPKYNIDCRGKVLELGRRTRVMGILNTTPDSFSDGGRHATPDRAVARALELAAGGADIIDVGGESTRPGAVPVTEDEELRRIIPVIERLAAELAIPISVDTYKSSVARKALEAGASIVNDISGLRFSPDMARVVADFDAAVVIMHIKGAPRTMQNDPVYTDLIGEVTAYLSEGIELAIRSGVARERILIDPGIGFGKTTEHNLELINRLDSFKVLDRPIVLGTSRKKFIGEVLNAPDPEQRLFGAAATVALGIERGAAVVRVHDVEAMSQTARMTDAVLRREPVL
jgi:dihydropteroate synthase